MASFDSVLEEKYALKARRQMREFREANPL